ncbi:class F sortase, partial [Streptomyces lunaelactis]|nr:class F sortase [Streptomyces lunaelactis]
MPTYSRRGSWFTVACVLLLGLFLLRNGSAEGAGGPPQPPSAVA